MKQIARWLLRLVTLVVPVVIAACYGPGTGGHGIDGYYKQGKVIDKLTRKGLSGIKVVCLYGNIDPGLSRCAFDGARTDLSGDFALEYIAPCDVLWAEQCPPDDGGSNPSTATPDAASNSDGGTADAGAIADDASGASDTGGPDAGASDAALDGADASDTATSAGPDGGAAIPLRLYKPVAVPFDQEAPTVLIEMERNSYRVLGQ